MSQHYIGNNTRRALTGLLYSHYNSTYGSRRFAKARGRLWNNIPDDVQTAKSVDMLGTNQEINHLLYAQQHGF